MSDAPHTSPLSPTSYQHLCNRAAVSLRVNLSGGVAPAARLQNRACGFHRTRLLSNPILVTDTPLRGALRPEFHSLYQIRIKSALKAWV